MDLAYESLATYIKQWLDTAEKAVVPSPMISSTSDRYGLLKPCMA